MFKIKRVKLKKPNLFKVCTISLDVDKRIHITAFPNVSQELIVDTLATAYRSIVKAQQDAMKELRIIIP